MIKLTHRLFSFLPKWAKFIVWVAMAFGSFIEFATFDSYKADLHHTGWVHIVIGTFLALATIDVAIVANSDNNPDAMNGTTPPTSTGTTKAV